MKEFIQDSLLALKVDIRNCSSCIDKIIKTIQKEKLKQLIIIASQGNLGELYPINESNKIKFNFYLFEETEMSNKFKKFNIPYLINLDCDM